MEDAAPLWLEARRLLSECRRILNARLSANTCLVGRCFAVEEDFYVRKMEKVVEAAREEALTPEQRAHILSVKRRVGYEACMETAYAGLQFAYCAATIRGVQPPPLTGKERAETRAFALRCVGIMATAPRVDGSNEQKLAKLLRALLASNQLEQPFKAELTRVWDRPTLQNALRARGVFDEGDAEHAARKKQMEETYKKKAAADRAKHGLRWCALPSCAKQEMRVFDFKQCSACKAVVYCSAGHAALHWTATHRTECASLKAAGAKPRSTADAGTERLRAHARQLAPRVSMACAVVALAIGLVLIAGSVMPRAAASLG